MLQLIDCRALTHEMSLIAHYVTKPAVFQDLCHGKALTMHALFKVCRLPDYIEKRASCIKIRSFTYVYVA